MIGVYNANSAKSAVKVRNGERCSRNNIEENEEGHDTNIKANQGDIVAMGKKHQMLGGLSLWRIDARRKRMMKPSGEA